MSPIPSGARSWSRSSWLLPDRIRTGHRSTRTASSASRASSGRSAIVFVDSLPKNSYGKVLKRELRLRLESER